MNEIILAGYSVGHKKFFTQRMSKEAKLIYGEMTSQIWGDKYPNLIPLKVIIIPLKIEHANYIVGHDEDGGIFMQRIHSDGNLSPEELFRFNVGGFCPNLFTFQMHGSCFIAGQTEKNKFFIKKIKSDTTGVDDFLELNWSNYYNVINVVPLGKKYLLYCHNADKNRFTTQFINSNGTLGEYKYDKIWARGYATIRHFFDGKQLYFYGQSKEDNKFFITPMPVSGHFDESPKGYDPWRRYYENINHCKVGNKIFVYGQSKKDNYFFISPVVDGILMDKTLGEGKSHFYKTQGTMSINGKIFFYGLSNDSDKKFIVQEFTNKGTLGDHIVSNPTKNDNWTRFYDFLFPVYDSDFLFGQDWMSHLDNRLTLKDICVPGTHDAGMYKLHDDIKHELDKLEAIVNLPLAFSSDKIKLREAIENFVLTQEHTIRQQLDRGVRYFDLRADYVKGVNVNLLKFKIGNICLAHGGVPGPTLDEVLSDVKAFMDAGSTETLTLMFTHFNEFKGSSQEFINKIEKYLGQYLLDRKDVAAYFSRNMNMKKTLSNLPLKNLRGKVIVGINSEIVTPYHINKEIKRINDERKKEAEDNKTTAVLLEDNEENRKEIALNLWENYHSHFDYDVLQGRHIYFGFPNKTWHKIAINDYPQSVPELVIPIPDYNLDLKIEDHYANQENYDDMFEDQFDKFGCFGSNTMWMEKFRSEVIIDINGGKSDGPIKKINQESLFSLDWTLTFNEGNTKAAKNEGETILWYMLANEADKKNSHVSLKTVEKFLKWSNKKKAREVNKNLINLNSRYKAILKSNPHGRKVNIISLDYVPSDILKLCLEITNA